MLIETAGVKKIVFVKNLPELLGISQVYSFIIYVERLQ